MYIKAVLGLILSILSFSLFSFERGGSKHIASCSHKDAHCKIAATGSINLMQTHSYAKAKNIHFILNDKVKGILRLYYSRTRQGDVIRGEFIIDNVALKKSHIQYRVVFKDKVGVVAQSKGDILLTRGKNQKMKFGSVVLTEEDMRNIDRYDIKIGSTS